MSDYIIASGELQHWGIKGQKWGVRRYQHTDGTLTAAGRKRYAKEAYEKEVEETRKKLNEKADKLYEKSNFKKWKDSGETIDYDPTDDPSHVASAKYFNQATMLGKNYVSNMTGTMGLAAVPLGIMNAGITAAVTKRKSIDGATRAGAIMGAFGGTLLAFEGAGAIAAKAGRTQVERDLGIKSVRERKKELKRSGR